MRRVRSRRLAAFCLAAAAAAGGGATALLGVCGPFSDVTDAAFCPFVLEIFILGITTGTTPTTYSPTDNVSRLQMAAFLSRTVDRTLTRGSRRAALEMFWRIQNPVRLSTTTVGDLPRGTASDGADVWVANGDSDTVSRVRASDARLQETWTGATDASGVLAAGGRIFVTGQTSPGRLFLIRPSQAAGVVTTVTTALGDSPGGIAFDGIRIWTANGGGGSVSIVTPNFAIPWTVTTVAGFSLPAGALYDGANVWITDFTAGTLLKLDDNAAVLQTVTVGAMPTFPAFDGTNIWVPNNGSSTVTVVRAASGAILATLTGNALNGPEFASFDGQRVLVTNPAANGFSLWKAADLSPIGSYSTGVGTGPGAVCNDGVSFWIALGSVDQLARF
jgi:hypothetical protein